MHVAQTAGAPPKLGSNMRVQSGWTTSTKPALMKTVAAKIMNMRIE